MCWFCDVFWQVFDHFLIDILDGFVRRQKDFANIIMQMVRAIEETRTQLIRRYLKQRRSVGRTPDRLTYLRQVLAEEKTEQRSSLYIGPRMVCVWKTRVSTERARTDRKRRVE